MNFKNRKLGKLRFWWSTVKRLNKLGTVLIAPAVLVKCGDCNHSIKIGYPVNKEDDYYTINDVIASRKEWLCLFKKIGLC